MSLVTSCTLASLLLSSAKFCLSIKKKKKHLKKQPSTRTSFFFSLFQSFILQQFFRRKTNRKSYGKFLKRDVCMLHVKRRENKVPGKWHLKHDNRYFHAQLLHITDITRCRSPPHPTRFCQKKKKNPASVWPGKANNQVGGKLVTMKRQCQNQQQARQSTQASQTSSPCPVRFCI